MTTIAPDLLPSDDDVESFARDGFWVSPPLFDADQLAAAAAAQDRFYAGHADDAGGRAVPDGHQAGQASGPLRKSDYAGFTCHAVAALYRSPAIGTIAARLARTGEVRLWHDQLLWKDSGSPTAQVGWHTDRSYWLTCTSDRMLTAWIPFTSVTGDMGALSVVPGSHLWPDDLVHGMQGFFDGHTRDDRWASAADSAAPVTLELQLGQVSFHDCRLVHGSGANSSGRPRRSVAVHLQDADNHYRRHVMPDGSDAEHPNDRLARPDADGRPDYQDPTWFPVLFPVPPSDA